MIFMKELLAKRLFPTIPSILPSYAKCLVSMKRVAILIILWKRGKACLLGHMTQCRVWVRTIKYKKTIYLPCWCFVFNFICFICQCLKHFHKLSGSNSIIYYIQKYTVWTGTEGGGGRGGGGGGVIHFRMSICMRLLVYDCVDRCIYNMCVVSMWVVSVV